MKKLIKNIFNRNSSEKIRILEDRKHAHIWEIREIIDEICKVESEKFNNFNYTSNAPTKELFHLAYIQRNLNGLLWLKRFRYVMLQERVFNKKIVFPLTKSWTEILIKHNYKVSATKSYLMYIGFLFGIVAKDYLALLKRKKRFSIKKVNQNLVPIYLDDFKLEQFSIGKLSKFTFVNWLKINLYQNLNLLIYHGNSQIRMKYKSITEDLITDDSFLSKFTFKENLAIYLSILKCFLFNFNVYLFYHLPNLWRYFAILKYPKKVVPSEFFFNCSRGSNMPLWVHGLIQQKISVQFIFYALYSEPRFLNGNVPNTELWRLSTWPSIICVDQVQSKEIFRDSKIVQKKFSFNDVPWWNDSEDLSDKIAQGYIALFDSFVGNAAFSLSVLDEYGLDKEESALKYLEDSVDMALSHGLVIVIKFKRNTGLNNSKQAVKLKNLLKLNPASIFEINHLISPHKLIQKSEFTICKPYSTIAKIGQDLKIPVVEYNASGLLLKDSFHIERKISRANSKQELFEFASKNLQIK